MVRAPFQILAIPYRKDADGKLEFAIFAAQIIPAGRVSPEVARMPRLPSRRMSRMQRRSRPHSRFSFHTPRYHQFHPGDLLEGQRFMRR